MLRHPEPSKAVQPLNSNDGGQSLDTSSSHSKAPERVRDLTVISLRRLHTLDPTEFEKMLNLYCAGERSDVPGSGFIGATPTWWSGATPTERADEARSYIRSIMEKEWGKTWDINILIEGKHETIGEGPKIIGGVNVLTQTFQDYCGQKGPVSELWIQGAWIDIEHRGKGNFGKLMRGIEQEAEAKGALFVCAEVKKPTEGDQSVNPTQPSNQKRWDIYSHLGGKVVVRADNSPAYYCHPGYGEFAIVHLFDKREGHQQSAEDLLRSTKGYQLACGELDEISLSNHLERKKFEEIAKQDGPFQLSPM